MRDDDSAAGVAFLILLVLGALIYLIWWICRCIWSLLSPLWAEPAVREIRYEDRSMHGWGAAEYPQERHVTQNMRWRPTVEKETIRESRFSNPAMAGWIAGNFEQLLQQFHDEYARFPSREIAKANGQLSDIIIRMNRYLQGRDIVREIICTGSSYEGLKIESSDLEYDLMWILDGGEYLIATPARDGYVTLTPKWLESSRFSRRVENGVLDPLKTRYWFYGQVQKCMNSLNLQKEVHDDTYCHLQGSGNPPMFSEAFGCLVIPESAVARYHGPACQVDIFNDRTGKLWFSIDMVPAYKVGGRLYVAKCCEDGTDAAAWRRSYSVEEKTLFQSIDSDGGCRRMCARVLKAICRKEATFHALPSYVIKTVLIHAHRDESDWPPSVIAYRLVDLMRRLSDALENGFLEHAFIPDYNILISIPSGPRQNMASRLSRLLNSPDRMRALLSD